MTSQGPAFKASLLTPAQVQEIGGVTADTLTKVEELLKDPSLPKYFLAELTQKAERLRSVLRKIRYSKS